MYFQNMRYPPLGSQEYETETNQAWSKLNKTPYIDYKIFIVQVKYKGYDALWRTESKVLKTVCYITASYQIVDGWPIFELITEVDRNPAPSKSFIVLA